MKRPTEAFWAELSRRGDRLGELSYYELLEVDVDANAEAIREAYQKNLSLLHPDRHARESAARKRLLTRICARMTEAHKVLADAMKRESYDRNLGAGHKRFEEGRGIKDNAAKADPAHPQARTLFEEGRRLLHGGDKQAAIAKLRLALQFEQGSAVIARTLAEARGEMPTVDTPSPRALGLAETVRTEASVRPTTTRSDEPEPAAAATPQPAAADGATLGRRHQRFPLGKPIVVRCSQWDQVKTLYLQNISRGGMLLRSDEVLEVGAVVEIAVHVPSGETIELPAQVVRHVPPTQPGQRPGLGLRLLAVPEQAKSQFERLLAAAAVGRAPATEPAPIAEATPVRSSFLIGNPRETSILTARAAMARRDYTSACKVLQPMLQQAPDDRMLRAMFHLAAGHLAKQRGQLDAARAHFERTLRYDPHSAEAVAELRGKGTD